MDKCGGAGEIIGGEYVHLRIPVYVVRAGYTRRGFVQNTLDTLDTLLLIQGIKRNTARNRKEIKGN